MRKDIFKVTNKDPSTLNHMRLYRFHLALAAFYSVVGVALIVAFWVPHELFVMLFSGILLLFPAWLHSGLAWGARRRSELSRKISEYTGALMIFAFPVGTLVAAFMLPLTQWDDIDK